MSLSPRVADGLQHRGENLIAIRQHVVVVAARRLRAQQGRHVRRKQRVVGFVQALDLEGLEILRRHQQERDDAEDDQD